MTKITSFIYSTALIILLGSCSAPVEKSKPTLKSALKDKFLIGTALNANQITGRDTASIRIIKEQFSAIVAENCMKSAELQPEEGKFNFDMADKLVAFGQENNLTVTGHTLIWHSQLPRWFMVDENGNDVTPEVLKQQMKDHITTVVTRYKGRIKGWDVVNEAIMENGSYRNSKFYQILGEEFIPLAFQYAQEADPEAELYYNDYNEWYTGKQETIIKLIETLKSRNIRIDGVGMQGHVGMESPSLEEYEAAIRAYASAGVKVMITEFDLSALPSPRRNVGANISEVEAYRQEVNPYQDGLPDSVYTAWNDRMMGFFDLFLRNSDKISRVTLWGVSDGDSWKNDFPMRGRTDYALLFDRNYQPKPIVNDIIQAAQEK